MPWLAALPLFILLVGPLALLALDRFRPEFRSHWMLSVALALIALLVLFYLRIRLPLSLTFGNWTLETGPATSGAIWGFDSISLPFAAAVLVIGLATLVVEIPRAVTEEWTYWVPGLALSATSLLAVMAANPLALAISWALLDALVLAFGLSWLFERAGRDYLLHRMGLGLLSTLLLIGGGLLGDQSFQATDTFVLALFSLAIALRLGALPLNPNFAVDLDLPPHRWAQLRILPAAAALALLARLDLSGLPAASILLALLWIGALYAAAKWLQQDDLLPGLPYWLLGTASLALSAALLGAPLAAQAAGLAWLLGGGLLALSAAGDSPRWPLVLLGGLSLGALPFTPAFGLAQLYGGALSSYAFLFPQGLLLFGWLRHAWRVESRGERLAPWARGIYLAGLFGLPVIHILLSLGLAPNLAPRNLTGLPLWPVVPLWLVAGVAMVLARRGRLLPAAAVRALDAVFSLRWFYAAVNRLLAGVEAVFDFLSGLLEGQAGVLWALLMITLLLSLIAQLAVES